MFAAATVVAGILLGLPCLLLAYGVLFWVGIMGMFIAAQYALMFPLWNLRLAARRDDRDQP